MSFWTVDLKTDLSHRGPSMVFQTCCRIHDWATFPSSERGLNRTQSCVSFKKYQFFDRDHKQPRSRRLHAITLITDLLTSEPIHAGLTCLSSLRIERNSQMHTGNPLKVRYQIKSQIGSDPSQAFSDLHSTFSPLSPILEWRSPLNGTLL